MPNFLPSFYQFAFLILMLCLGSAHTSAQVQKISLANGLINAEITPDIGGRLLSFSLKGQSNFLLLSDLSKLDTDPEVTPESSNITYFGHEVWVGPQSEWWIHQNLNRQRAAAKAEWPPDPYLILAKNKIIKQTGRQVVLESPKSKLTGVQLLKSYSLLSDRKNSLKLQVRATNIRRENVAWDIWFNTRVPSNASVYVPVSDVKDVVQKNREDAVNAALTYTVSDGVLSLDMLMPPQGKMSRRGKLMIQPSQGWMASFYGNQVFIVQFPLKPFSAIHPEQGQIELYNEFNPTNLNDGFLEMEVHAPYKRLAPKESMYAEEVWTLLAYDGEANRAAHVAFLREHAVELGLQ